MGKKLNFDGFEAVFSQGKERFYITGKEYEAKTGKSLPTGKDYLKKRSPFAKWLEEKGYCIVDAQEEAVIETRVYIEKKEKI